MVVPLLLGVLGAFAVRQALKPARPSQLHAVSVAAPQGYVDALRAQGDAGGAANGQKLLLQDVGDRLATIGWQKPLLVTQDPTEPTRFVAIARPSEKPLRAEDVLRIEGAEPVEEPSFLSDVTNRPDGREPRLDPGLDDLEVRTVRAALRVEDNPAHLEGFAASFEPFFPVAASLLKAKALDPSLGGKLLTLAGEGRPDAAAIQRARAALEAFAAARGLPLPLVLDDVRRVACVLVEGTATEPERSLAVEKVPPEVLALARLLIKAVPSDAAEGDAVLVVDPKAERLAMPPTGDEGYVSKTALNLVVAGSKPSWAGVKHADKVALRFATLNEGTTPDDMRALAMMERAERAVERRRWLEWYRKMLGGSSW